jgi:serine/threonine protein kinase
MCNGNEASDVFSSVNSIHVAPEIYTFEPVTDAVDWWCFGAILYELLVGMVLLDFNFQMAFSLSV